MSAAGQLPVTVLTGYLGAGKTTLLNRILTGSHGRKLAVIVNEFGEIGIDHELIVDTREEVVELSNGCLCCTFRGDLVATLERLLRRRDPLDGVLVETTGLAAPVPVAQSFYVTNELRERLRLDAIVTVVDGRHVELHLETSPEACEQIACADVLLLNKLDQLDDADATRVTGRLRALNPGATLHATSHADVPLSAVLDVGAFDLSRLSMSSTSDAPARHEAGVGSLSLAQPGDLDPERLTMWLRFLATRRGQDLFRLKGVLALAGDPRRQLVQGVHTMLETSPGRPWGPAEERGNRLVFVGRQLDGDELRRGLLACRADLPR